MKKQGNPVDKQTLYMYIMILFYENVPRPLENSAKQVPKEGFLPHLVSEGGLPSTSLMCPENTLIKY